MAYTPVLMIITATISIALIYYRRWERMALYGNAVTLAGTQGVGGTAVKQTAGIPHTFIPVSVTS